MTPGVWGSTTAPRCASPAGTAKAVLPAEVTTRVHTGQLFATFSDPATFVNRLTGPQRDPRTHTPQYKVTAVRLEPISRA